MFEKQKFSDQQIKKYFNSALKDFNIANGSEIPEIIFKFCYDSLLKVAITISAKNNFRVKSRTGHHIELLKKLAEYLDNEDILIVSNEMRKKRNFELYDGGILISEKEALNYREWLKKIIIQAEEYLNKNQRLF